MICPKCGSGEVIAVDYAEYREVHPISEKGEIIFTETRDREWVDSNEVTAVCDNPECGNKFELDKMNNLKNYGNE